jgi:cell division protein FtsW
MMRRQKSNPGLLKNGEIVSSSDRSLVYTIFILVFFGIIMVFSAGAPEGNEIYNNSYYYLIRHLISVVFGFIFLRLALKFDFRHWKELAVPFGLFTIFMIFLTYVPFLGRTTLGSSRWLTFLPFQPSELAKPAVIFLAAAALADTKNIFTSKMFAYLALIGVMFLLILFQPNLSIAMIIATITVAMFFAGGISLWLITVPGLLLGTMVLFHVRSTKYQLARITGWLNPWADPQGTGYNLIQSWYAIGSGGIWGLGFGNSKQKLFWLPFRHTDFIFAVIAEELGMIGCLVLIGLFLALIHRGFLIANRCENVFGKFLAFGITFSIGLQAFINIGVATGVLPVTGVTLPLISYGGSSMFITMFMLGILLNISRKRIKKIYDGEKAYG